MNPEDLIPCIIDRDRDYIQSLLDDSLPFTVLGASISPAPHPVLYTSPAFTTLTGYTAAKLADPDVYKPWAAQLEHYVAQKRDVAAETNAWRADQTRFFDQIFCTPIRAEDESGVAVVAHVTVHAEVEKREGPLVNKGKLLRNLQRHHNFYHYDLATPVEKPKIRKAGSKGGMKKPPTAIKLVSNSPSKHGFTLRKKVTSKEIEFLQKMLDLDQMFVLVDPQLPDNPVVYASPQFLDFMEYRADEVIGKNCRFLQGPGTDPRDVEVIRKAISKEKEALIPLVNFKKNGELFFNQFFIAPVRSYNKLKMPARETRYFVGVQQGIPHQGCEVVMNQGKIIHDQMFKKRGAEFDDALGSGDKNGTSQHSSFGSIQKIASNFSGLPDGDSETSDILNLNTGKPKSKSSYSGGAKVKPMKFVPNMKPEKVFVSQSDPAIHFTTKKKLIGRDTIFLQEMLDRGEKFCITDPSLPDHPIIYTSPGFAEKTGYKDGEMFGRNCRFLQGPATEEEDVKDIVNAIKDEKDALVYLLNYTRDGKMFSNQFFLTPLKTYTLTGYKAVYFIGVMMDQDIEVQNRKEILNYGKLFRDKQDAALDDKVADGYGRKKTNTTKVNIVSAK